MVCWFQRVFFFKCLPQIQQQSILTKCGNISWHWDISIFFPFLSAFFHSFCQNIQAIIRTLRACGIQKSLFEKKIPPQIFLNLQLYLISFFHVYSTTCMYCIPHFSFYPHLIYQERANQCRLRNCTFGATCEENAIPYKYFGCTLFWFCIFFLVREGSRGVFGQRPWDARGWTASAV